MEKRPQTLCLVETLSIFQDEDVNEKLLALFLKDRVSF
jgi:hypothetical protein